MIGSIVYATNQGLGILAKDFYNNGIIDKVVVQPHKHRENHSWWYPDRLATAEELLDICDTLLFFETPFYNEIVYKAVERKIKTVIMPMYECSNPIVVNEFDLILNPSNLEQEFFPQGTRINVPVSQKWRLRKKAEVFVHNAGHGGLGGRNGTRELIEAFKHVKSDAKLIIRTQGKDFDVKDPRIEVRCGTVGYESLYKEGDVFIFPEKFNGLSLPLQEAYASGMLVMAGNRSPINSWLPLEPLIPVNKYTTESLAVSFPCAVYDPAAIAQKIDQWYGEDITEFSRKGKKWAEQNSWEILKPKYLSLCEK